LESVCQEKEGGCREELVTIGEVVGIFSRWLDERVCNDEIVSERIIHAFGDLLVRKIISGRSHRLWIFSLGYFLFFCKSYLLSFPLIKSLFH
jgi:hypothetical protein